jgi:hypothetical protein
MVEGVVNEVGELGGCIWWVGLEFLCSISMERVEILVSMAD